MVGLREHAPFFFVKNSSERLSVCLGGFRIMGDVMLEEKQGHCQLS